MLCVARPATDAAYLVYHAAARMIYKTPVPLAKMHFFVDTKYSCVYFRVHKLVMDDLRMMRSGHSMTMSNDALIRLVAGAMAADYTAVRRAGAVLADALQESSPETARELRSLLNRKGVALRASGFTEALPVDAKSRFPLIEEVAPPTTPLFIDQRAGAIFTSFLADVAHHDVLTKAGLSSRLSLLLSGPPGTGKSLLAGHVAAHLGRPLYVVRLDSVISSLLGDTAKNIRSIFDFVPSRGVLFLDEIDAVAKLRDDRQEMGELKRVVNTLLQGLDSLDDRAVVIGATNHAQLLDPAVWRRFPYLITLGLPDEDVRSDLWVHFLADPAATPTTVRILAAISTGLSGADIQSVAFAARRKALLAGREVDLADVAAEVLRAGGKLVDDDAGAVRASTIQAAVDEGASQADIAKMLGVTRQAISASLRGSDRHGARAKRRKTST
ncbi:AAA family ATPase [Luteibacter sp. 9135]|uniref:AAA family ATPase n=1 Tax=Luteibacter sp. 9135 TaxID=1500893 RepID=UPI001C835990|nr:AAA family ATPase [Luteibacter sp. 9135]